MKKTSNKWIVILIMIAMFIILVGSIIRLLTPKIPTTDPKLTNNQNVHIQKDQQTIYKNIKIETTEPKIANTLPIFKITTNYPDIDALADSIISRYQLNQHPKVVNLYSFQQTSLIKEKDLIIINFRNSDEKSTTSINVSLASQIAKEKLLEFIDANQLSPDWNNAIYATGTFELRQDNQARATLVIIPFRYQLNNHPLFIDSSNSAVATVFINSNNQIIKIHLSPKTHQSENIGQVNTVSAKQAIFNVINQKQTATITDSDNLYVDPINLSTIREFYIYDIQIQYRLNTETQIAYPYYQMSGNAINNEDQRTQLTIITPAFLVK